jgi:hypothetical protein
MIFKFQSFELLAKISEEEEFRDLGDREGFQG